MEQRIDKKVLEYMGIYKTKEATKQKKDFALKVRDDIQKITNLFIERVYLMDDYAWGKEDGTPAIALLSDVRVKDIEKIFHLVSDYCYEKNVRILMWSMCQFEKRKKNPTELDYYIENYGVKVYDEGSVINIDENVKATMYAGRTQTYRQFYEFEKDHPEQLLKSLLEIYALKINYPVNMERSLEETIEYIKYISKDKYILETIEKFNVKDADQFKLCSELEEYIKKLKQIKPIMELEDKPTMKVYERLSAIKEKQGKVNKNNITGYNLYTMYVIQKRNMYEIANLFDTDQQFISTTCKKFGIRTLDSFWYESAEDMVRKTCKNDMQSGHHVLREVGVFNFEAHTYDILDYMRDGEKYLLKEFWQFTNGERSGIELHKAKTAKNVYFRAYLCAELLKQNNLIEEVDYLTYRITNEGKDTLKRAILFQKKKLGLIDICELNGAVDFYAISITRLPNGIILYDSTLEELEVYEKEEIEASDYDEVQNNEPKGLEEISFDKVPAKVKKKRDKKQRNSVKTDYEKVNNAKEAIRKKSERLVYDMERQKLIDDNREDLLKKVIWESEEHGDGAGYDIQSLEKRDGEYVEIYIEVKGTNKNINEPFEISVNEVEKSNECGDRYYIYRVGNIHSEKPKFYKINGRIEDNFKLEATNYLASKKIQQKI